MKDIKEKVTLNTEEAQMVAGGFSFSSTNLASHSIPSIGVYAQVAPTVSLKPVAALDFGALTLGR